MGGFGISNDVRALRSDLMIVCGRYPLHQLNRSVEIIGGKIYLRTPVVID